MPYGTDATDKSAFSEIFFDTTSHKPTLLLASGVIHGVIIAEIHLRPAWEAFIHRVLPFGLEPKIAAGF